MHHIQTARQLMWRMLPKKTFQDVRWTLSCQSIRKSIGIRFNGHMHIESTLTSFILPHASLVAILYHNKCQWQFVRRWHDNRKILTWKQKNSWKYFSTKNSISRVERLSRVMKSSLEFLMLTSGLYSHSSAVLTSDFDWSSLIWHFSRSPVETFCHFAALLLHVVDNLFKVMRNGNFMNKIFLYVLQLLHRAV
jgi:hypothetical protein